MLVSRPTRSCPQLQARRRILLIIRITNTETITDMGNLTIPYPTRYPLTPRVRIIIIITTSLRTPTVGTPLALAVTVWSLIHITRRLLLQCTVHTTRSTVLAPRENTVLLLAFEGLTMRSQWSMVRKGSRKILWQQILSQSPTRMRKIWRRLRRHHL